MILMAKRIEQLLAQAIELRDNFNQVVKLAGFVESEFTISVVASAAPHDLPPALKNGDVAVYAFIWNNECLKVGKVGPKSHARYISHHYNPSSSQSNLAKSILADKESMGLKHLTDQIIGDWIRSHVDRVNFVLSGEKIIPVLNLLEAFLQCRLKPRYEGFKSQR